MTNFDFLLSEPAFAPFAGAAVKAEHLLHIDTASCVLACRRAMEIVVKWMYTADERLPEPEGDTLARLMNAPEFRSAVQGNLHTRMEYIRKLGNMAAHGQEPISPEQGTLCLENLFYFLDYVAYCYAAKYTPHTFNEELLAFTAEEALSFVTETETDAQTNFGEAARRTREGQPSYLLDPLESAGSGTRRLYIDAMLFDAGWTEGRDLFRGAALQSAGGAADLLLGDADHAPLGVLIAVNAGEALTAGERRAENAGAAAAARYGFFPFLFVSNGFDTVLKEPGAGWRRVAAVFSKRDLAERAARLRSARPLSLNGAPAAVADRYYQKQAVKKLGEQISGAARSALVSMPAGAGKTRTVIAFCAMLKACGRPGRALYLTGGAALAAQAKRDFESLLPGETCLDLCAESPLRNAAYVFADPDGMTGLIDTARDGAGRIFTAGCFDLLICDGVTEAFAERYRDLLSYFDAFRVGLSAAPAAETPPAVLSLFGPPVYSYDAANAVKDGFLIDFVTVDASLTLPGGGETGSGGGRRPKAAVSSLALQGGVFREAEIREALGVLREKGLYAGGVLGKTVVFAENAKHAEKILAVWREAYPEPRGFAEVIDGDEARQKLAAFASPAGLPRVAISAGLLDQGVDVPEVLNLVFLKKAADLAQFRQMIGRGTRPCADPGGGEPKTVFFVFDFCGNFASLGAGKHVAAVNGAMLSAAVFRLRARLIPALSRAPGRAADPQFRAGVAAALSETVRALDAGRFSVRQHLKYVEAFSDAAAFLNLTPESLEALEREIAPLIPPDAANAAALRFDALLCGMELLQAAGKPYDHQRGDLRRAAKTLLQANAIKKTPQQTAMLRRLSHKGSLQTEDAPALERIRVTLRDLIAALPEGALFYQTGPDSALLATVDRRDLFFAGKKGDVS